MPTTSQTLERGRRAFANRQWKEAYRQLSAADTDSPLEPADLECLAQAACLIGRDSDAQALFRRAHHVLVDLGQRARAAHWGFWLSFHALLAGDSAQSTGWLARIQRLVADQPECAEQGYVDVLSALRQMAQGDADAARASCEQAISLAERFGGRHVTPAVFEAMVAEVARLLDGFEGRDRLAHLASGAGFHLLGTSGTVTTLAGVHLGLERYDRRRVDGLWMENCDVDAMIGRLLSWDFEQRMANPCIGADRADLVLAGCAILEAIRRRWPSERLRVADRGLREGMLSELMADDGVWRRNRREAYSR